MGRRPSSADGARPVVPATPLRILLVEDSKADAGLVLREFNRAGLVVDASIVQNEVEFRQALADVRPQVILSDYALPRFSGARALEIAREEAPDTPFIYVSGTMGEEHAVRCLKEGATDYILKSNLARLPAAVAGALERARERESRRRAERALLDNATGLRRAQGLAGLAHVITAGDGSFESWSDNLAPMLGLPDAELPRNTRQWLKLVHPDDRARFRAESIKAGKLDARAEFEYRLQHKDGAWLHLRQVSEPISEAVRGRLRWFGTIQDVTAEKQVAAALASSESRYRTTFEQAAVGIVHTSLEGEIQMANQTFCEMCGLGRAEAIQRHIRDVTHPEDFARSVEDRAKILEGGGRPYQRELRLLRKDGSHTWVSVTTSAVRDRAGKPRHFVSVLSDISERKRVEAALVEGERNYRSLFEANPHPMWMYELNTLRFVAVNDAAIAHYGYSREEFLSMTIADIRPAGDLPRLREIGAAQARDGAWQGGAWLHRKKNGSLIEVEITSHMSEFAGRRVKVVLAHDVTERNAAESEVRRFQAAMDVTPDSIYLTDPETMRFLYVNDTACKRLGYTRQELMQKTSYEVVGKTRAQIEPEYAVVVAAGEQGMSSESRFVRKDGSDGWTELHRRALLIDGKRLIVTIGRDITDRKRATTHLAESEARFRSLTELSSDFYWETDAEHRILRVTHGSQHQPVVGAGQIGKRRWDTPSTRPDAAGWAAHRAALEARRPFRDFEVARIDAKGVERFLSLSGAPVFDDAGAFKGYRGVGKDITENKAQQKRIERLSRVHAVLSGINAAIVRIGERIELFRETCRIAVSAGGFSIARVIELDEKGVAKLAATSESGSDVFQEVLDAYNRDPPGSTNLLGQALQGGKPVVSNDLVNDPRVHERTTLASEGTYALALLPLLVEGRTAGVILLRSREAGIFDEEEMALLTELAGDVAFALANIAKSAQLDYLVLHDPLTRLANRTLLAERLSQQITNAGPQGAKFALALLDIERLTTINESLGRQAGDALIRQVGERLARATGAALVGRVAADHFAVVLPTVKGRSEAGRVFANLARACFGEPYLVESTELRVAAKAGLALFPNDGADADTLLGNAEAALRKAKETGERQVFYTADLIERTGMTLTLENKLRRALENEEFVLHYQPKVALEDRRIIGTEALIRWQSPELGLVPPMKFIPLMEETGMILEVGTWALKRASRDHRRWTESGLKPPRVAVNVSPIQLRQKDFVAAVEQAIMEGVAPTGIDLEITESLIMEDIEGNIGKLREVRGLGVGLAIDDFGTGYSSLSYLAKLPVQMLKIDRSFVITMLNEPDTMTLVQTIISLAHSLRLKVVAEGVDAEEQAKVLRLLRCDQMQGYLFSKPVPFDELTTLLRGS